MNNYKKLYEHCQNISVPPHVSSMAIKAKAEELTGSKIVILKAGLDTKACRGLFFSANNLESPFLIQAKGNPVVVIARGMNRCWDRLVQVKEIMHLFDSESEKTSSSAEFEKLLQDITSPPSPGDSSKQLFSEHKAFWMALGCLCPETNRQQFMEDYNRKHIDHYGIALKLRIPEQHVPNLLSERFLDIIGVCSKE